MNFRAMGNKEVALILHGLRAIHVADDKELLAKMIKACEETLAARGLSLAYG